MSANPFSSQQQQQQHPSLTSAAPSSETTPNNHPQLPQHHSQEHPSNVSASQKRVEAFAHLDGAKLGWFHLRTVIVSGVGFFTDAYDVFVISQALGIIYQVYWGSEITESYNGTPYTPQNYRLDFNELAPHNKHIDALLKASTNWGNLVGQLAFGYLGDKLGRKRMYGIELMIMIVCTLGSALSAPPARGFSVLTILAIWRFFLGIGIGGDYPMSAVITSEFSSVRYRGMMIGAVFAMQGIGILMGGVAFVVTLLAFRPLIQEDYLNLDYVWRIAIGVGVIPAIIAIYFRLTIPETPRYTVDVDGDTEKAQNDVQRVLEMNEVSHVTSNWGSEKPARKTVQVKKNDFFAYYSQWKNLKILLGTAYCWFALDIAFYGIQLNNSTILNLINFNGPAKVNGKIPPHDVWDLFYQNAVGNIIIACAGTVPGYWFTVFLCERWGRKPIQYMGFTAITVILVILSAGWNSIKDNQTVFVTLFTIAQFFFQFGPNTTTFIIPGEVFPTRFRSTGHGISAAAGKLGAIIGIQAVGPYFSESVVPVLATFAIVMATGFLATMLLPEPKGKSLEELSGEDDVIVAEEEEK
ncbi:phosphate transporter [Phlyctochytrium planicorne]|nr:phosphate transporter [Phlyctochytrium planicorne]